METIRKVFKIGPGPSSSHTIGPYYIAKDFIKNNKDLDEIEVYLYGSLALTGKGHGTDKIIEKTLKDYKCSIHFEKTFNGIEEPNTIDLVGKKQGQEIVRSRYYSIGGGEIIKQGDKISRKEIYPFSTFDGLKNFLTKNNISDLAKVVDIFEDDSIDDFLRKIFNQMISEIESNIDKVGFLPGNLGTKRVAKEIYEKALICNDFFEKRVLYITSYAYAASEGNACGDIVVTAPTCGSCGILPAILYYEYKHNKVPKSRIVNALKVSGLLTNFIKKNASISGAALGCQAEIGSASSIASAALCYLNDLNIYQIEYASELALEHFLGLTCDPVNGYVQIPCIERNGVGALRSLIAYIYAKDIAPYRKNKVSFDEVVKAMKLTGDSLSKDYKETSIGGLAKIITK